MAATFDVKALVVNACKEKFAEIAPAKAIEFANQLKGLAGSAVAAEVKSVGEGDIAVGSPNINGLSAEIGLSFSSNLHRNSLVPAKYTGVDDIVNLFEHGWSARGTVRGVWHGREVWSRRSRPAGSMLKSAVAAFNASAPAGVKATLNGPYG